MLTISESYKLPLHKHVYNVLKESILSGHLKPGEKLIEDAISKELSISKTPIREAIRELTQEGLIIHHSRRGISIIDFTEKDIQEIISFRILIEEFGITLALPQLTEEDKENLKTILERIFELEKNNDYKGIVKNDMLIHAMLIEKSGHSRLIKAWHLLESQILVLLNMINYQNMDYHYSGESHRVLIETILSGNEEEAKKACKEHIRTSGKNVLYYFKNGINN